MEVAPGPQWHTARAVKQAVTNIGPVGANAASWSLPPRIVPSVRAFGSQHVKEPDGPLSRKLRHESRPQHYPGPDGEACLKLYARCGHTCSAKTP